jgi:hypothetical protein
MNNVPGESLRILVLLCSGGFASPIGGALTMVVPSVAAGTCGATCADLVTDLAEGPSLAGERRLIEPSNTAATTPASNVNDATAVILLLSVRMMAGGATACGHAGSSTITNG